MSTAFREEEKVPQQQDDDECNIHVYILRDITFENGNFSNKSNPRVLFNNICSEQPKIPSGKARTKAKTKSERQGEDKKSKKFQNTSNWNHTLDPQWKINSTDIARSCKITIYHSLGTSLRYDCKGILKHLTTFVRARKDEEDVGDSSLYKSCT